jgi:hypothetical protein
VPVVVAFVGAVGIHRALSCLWPQEHLVCGTIGCIPRGVFSESYTRTAGKKEGN